MKFFSDNMKCLESATVLCSNRKEEEEERDEDCSKPELNIFKSQPAHIFRYDFFKSPHIFSGRSDVTSDEVNLRSDIRQKFFERNQDIERLCGS